MDRKSQAGEEARLIVVERQLAVVKVRNRLYEGETQAGAFVRTTGIEAPEAPQSLFTPLRRDAGAGIGHLDTDLPLPRGHADVDPAAIRSVADCILQEIAERLGKQLAVPVDGRRPRRAVEAKRCTLLVGQRVVHFHKLR